MPIDAIALLRIPVANATVPGPARVQPLSDAVLIHTGLEFAEEPEVLSSALRALLGDELLDQHSDVRGVFFIPDVAAPKARSYDAVIEEVGEGGVWGPLPAQLAAAVSGGGLDALLGGMLSQLPGGLIAQASAALQQNPDALQAASAQLKGMLDNPQDLKAMAGAHLPGLQNLLSGSGLDLNSPELREMAEKMQAELQRDPARLARFAEQLFAGGAIDEEEGEEDDET